MCYNCKIKKRKEERKSKEVTSLKSLDYVYIYIYYISVSEPLKNWLKTHNFCVVYEEGRSLTLQHHFVLFPHYAWGRNSFPEPPAFNRQSSLPEKIQFDVDHSGRTGITDRTNWISVSVLSRPPRHILSTSTYKWLAGVTEKKGEKTKHKNWWDLTVLLCTGRSKRPNGWLGCDPGWAGIKLTLLQF